MDEKLNVEVAYAEADRQVVLHLQVPVGSRVIDAIECSGIAGRFPEIDVHAGEVGIFSHPCSLQNVLADGDRVEIYRPLKVDPKEARRLRAKQPPGD